MAITNKKSLKKFILLGSLYASQFIPLVFLSEAVPVFMRQQGISLEAIGLLSLTALPVTLKFLWSTLIDRYGFTRWGHYRFWIILFQLLVVLTTAIVAFLEIKNSFTVLFICMFSIALFCSTQDIASDALAVGILKPQERGLGNGIQSAGGYFGAIVGGGGMLILLNIWGWKITLLAMSFIMAISLIPLLFYKEQQTNSN
ncbi:MAG: MFS transporter, partial [Rivularia sp. ALOHA_DT_140]|nr:MFS transporter [Rivularia sp. ALOHA_DT_140]